MDWQEADNSYNAAPQQPGGFVMAALICGIASVVLCCGGPLTVPIGALGILFAVLSRRRGQATHPLARSGIILSILGMIMGIAVTVYSFYALYNDPEMEPLREMYEQIWDSYYGTDFGEPDSGTESLPGTNDLPSNVL